MKTKAHISCEVTAQLISAFGFATLLVQTFYFLNPKSSNVAVQPGLCRTWSKSRIHYFAWHTVPARIICAMNGLSSYRHKPECGEINHNHSLTTDVSCQGRYLNLSDAASGCLCSNGYKFITDLFKQVRLSNNSSFSFRRWYPAWLFGNVHRLSTMLHKPHRE